MDEEKEKDRVYSWEEELKKVSALPEGALSTSTSKAVRKMKTNKR